MAEIKKISTEFQLLDKFLDTSGDAGTSGQILSSTATGINWVSGSSLPGGPYLPLSAGSSYPLTGGLYIPSYIYHTGDTNTLFGFGGQDLFIINTGGGRRLTVTNTEATFENNLIIDGNVGIGTTSPQSKLQVAGGIQMADDTATASATKVGTMRYRTGTEYVEVTGVDLADGWTFTSGWNAFGGGTSITNSTTFVSQSGQGIYAGLGLTTSKTYKVVIAGTQPSGGYISIKAGTTGTLFGNISEQSFDKVLYATLTTVSGNTNSFYIRLADHASNTSIVITKLEIQEVTAEDASYADMCMQTGASTYEWVNIVRNTY